MTRTHAAPTVPRSTGVVRAVQAAAALSVVVLLWQFVSAGRIIGESAGVDGHGAGAIVLHVPGALVLTVGTVWVTAWAFRRA